MPGRRRHGSEKGHKTAIRKKGRARRGNKTGVVKSSTRQGKTMILYKAPNNVPFPDVYFDKFRTEALCYINSGSTAGIPVTMNASGEWVCRIRALDIIAPFTNLGAIAAVGGSSTNASVPLDVTRLINGNLYSSYQVLATKLSVEVLPQDSTDMVMAALMPTNNGIPATYAQAMLEKDTKVSEFRTNTRSKPLSIYVQWNKFFGLDKTVYTNDITGNYSAAYNGTPLTVAYIDILLQTPFGSALVSAAGLKIKMTQYIRAWGFTQSV
nr:MAG: capsid protein [Cressdnaviricota sp.]